MAKKRIPDLHVEFACDRGNYFFLGVLQHRKETYLVIVDNITDEEVSAYVLDFAQREGIDLQQFISVATQWFYRGSHRYPLSFEFSRLGLSGHMNRIYKNFELTHVTRLIGNGFKYDFFSAPKVKRRRVSKIPAGIEVKLKKTGNVVRFLK